MRIKVEMDKKAIRELMIHQQDALIQTASELRRRIINDAVMPFDIGTMQNESTFVREFDAPKGIVTIVTDTKYAMRLYMHPEYNFQKVNNANAKGEWWEDYIRGSKRKEPLEIFKVLLQRNARRYIDKW